MGCVQCFRIILVIINFLVVLVGLAILGVSVYVYVEEDAQAVMKASGYYTVLQVINFIAIGLASATLIIAMVGCCGAYHESQCLLGTYISILMIILCTQIVIGALGYFYHDQIIEYADEGLRHGVEQNKMGTPYREDTTPFLGLIERMLHCCGANNYQDYKGYVPVSCCDEDKSTCHQVSLTVGNIYEIGCKEAYKTELKKYISAILIVTFSIAAFEVLCLLLSGIMCCTIRVYHSSYYGPDYALTRG